ncbi:MAG: hypothetical protein R3F60_19815 [bacterium]
MGREADADHFRGFVAYDLAGGGPDGLLDLLVLAEPAAGALDWRLIAFVGHDGPGFYEVVKRGEGTGLDAAFAGSGGAVAWLATGSTPRGPLIALGAGDRAALYVDPTEVAAWQQEPIQPLERRTLSGLAFVPGAGGHALFSGPGGARLGAPGGADFEVREAPEVPAGPVAPAVVGGQAGVLVAAGRDLVFGRVLPDGRLGGRRAAAALPAGTFTLLAAGQVGGAPAVDAVAVDATPGAGRLVVALDLACGDAETLAVGQVIEAALPDDLGPVGVVTGAFSGAGPEILLYNPAGRMVRWRVDDGALVGVP